MKKFILIMSIILFLSFIQNVFALNQGIPEYKLVLVTKDTEVSPGDTFNLSVYIVGLGKINEGGSQIGPYSDESFNLREIYFLGNPSGTAKNFLNTILIGIREKLVEDLFKPGLVFNFTGGEIGTLAEAGYNKDGNKIPPILINFEVPPFPKGGDHQILVTFKYTDGESWYVSKEFATIHIRTLFERNQVWIGLFIVLLSIMVIDWKLNRLLSFSGILSMIIFSIIISIYFNKFLWQFYLVIFILILLSFVLKKKKIIFFKK